jgi:hypothetical protein
MNRTNQKNPRRSAMQQGSRFKPCEQWHCYGYASLLHALTLPIYPEISREAQQPMVNAVVEFFRQRSTISARMRRLAAASIPLTAKGRYRSGQTGQTVNLLALRLRWFESSPAQIFTCAQHRLPRPRNVPKARDSALSDQNPLRQRTLQRLFSAPRRARSVASSLATFAPSAVSTATAVSAASAAAPGRPLLSRAGFIHR